MKQDTEKTHVFLTGERGAGKSRTVRLAAGLLEKPCFGFLTLFSGEDRTESALYMVPPGRRDCLDEAHRVAVRENGRIRPLTERFDALGAALLREARSHPEGLILMDEIGHLEKDARVFRAEILRCLDGDCPVLGVLRRDQEWHGFIREHPRVLVLETDGKTPETLAQMIAEYLRR